MTTEREYQEYQRRLKKIQRKGNSISSKNNNFGLIAIGVGVLAILLAVQNNRLNDPNNSPENYPNWETPNETHTLQNRIYAPVVKS